MNNVKRPLKRSFLAGIALLIAALCVAVCVFQYFSIRHTFLQSYEAYIGNVLRFTAAKIDADDLAKCIRTGEESEKFHALQALLNDVRSHIIAQSLYVVAPLNTEKTDDIKNVIAAAPENATEGAGERLKLNQLTGDVYSQADAQKYLDACRSGELSFFEKTSQRSKNLTGLLPLLDSEGKIAAALCMDTDISQIQAKTKEHLLNTALIIVSIGLLLASAFMVWADQSILKPIRILEKKVVQVIQRSHGPQDTDAIVLSAPEIKTNNEVGMMARSVEQMSRDLRDYMNNLIAKEKELAQLSSTANRDDLTHVGNLNAYKLYAEKLQMNTAEEKTEFSILIADVDDLKRVNDTYGHDRGDQYLKNCCAVICDVFRHSPVFRIGGDEFAVVLTGEDFQNRRDLVRIVRESFRHSRVNEEIAPWERMSVSVGIADYQETVDNTVEDVHRRADHAMHEARTLKQQNM